MRRRRGGFSLSRGRRGFATRAAAVLKGSERVISLRLGALGLALAVFCALAPALPWGPMFAQPPIPLAGLWVAFGLATDREGKARMWSGPLLLVLLGLLQDLLLGAPPGFHALLFVGCYLIAWAVARGGMSGSERPVVWTAFALTCLGVLGLAWLIAPQVLGRGVEFGPFGLTLAITAALFWLTMKLYRQDV
jgi:hypothetical protein